MVQITKHDSTAVATISRGKVNALNSALIGELKGRFQDLETDPETHVVVLTGGDSAFFSFGFDVPELYRASREEFAAYVLKFTKFCTFLFLFPKPVIAALNGHTIAGGCMLAIACDYRIMVSSKAKISLNEVSFGSTVFAGSSEMLVHTVGARNAERITLTGAMFGAGEALQLGLVDEVCDPPDLEDRALLAAARYGNVDLRAFASAKQLLRAPVAERAREREGKSIDDFIHLWYSETTRKNLKRITIRD